MMNCWLVLAVLLCTFLPLKIAFAFPTRIFSSPSAVDSTLIRGASGEEVVEGCIEKLNQLAVFPNDFGFMKRIAKVETDFGTSYASASPDRGIWQVSVAQIAHIQSNAQDPAISAALSSISSYYGATYVDFGNFEMTVPFHSAIAARIYIHLMLNATSTSAPGGLVEQAAWWSSIYRASADPNLFITTVNSFESSQHCSTKPMDIWFLLDDSSSVGDRHFEIGIDFVREMVRKFVLSPNNVQVGFSLYSSTTTTISRLNEDSDNLAFETTLNSTIHQRGRTYTGAAINYVIDNGFIVSNGARPYSDGVPRILVLLTDGYSSDDVTEAATRAHSSGITTFAVGIGEGIKEEEINTISSYPPSTYAYNVEQYDDLLDVLVERLAMQFCKVSAFISSSSSTFSTATTSIPGYVYTVVPTSSALTIEASSTSGTSAIVYLSSIPNPTPSLHINAITINPGISTTLIVSSSAPSVSARNSGSTHEISVTGFQTSATIVPLYMTVYPTNSNVQLEFKIITETVVTTTTTTTTPAPTTTTSPFVEQPVEVVTPLEWWAILGIIFAILFFIFLILCIILIALGISRSSKYPSCSDSFVFSLCSCVAKSPGY